MENNEEDDMPIRAALITMPPDDPAQVADLARVLYGGTDFKLAILGYKPKSVLSPGFRDPITGLSMAGFAADQFIKYGHGKIQLHCKQIWKYLEDVLSKDTRVEFNYISGRPYKVVNRLKSMFDLFIIPRPFSLPHIGHSIFANVDLRLAQAREIPILFWARPEKWRHITIVKAQKDRDYGETLVKNYLLKFLGKATYEEQTDDMSAIALHADISARRSLPLSSYDTLDATELSSEEQAATVLVVSSNIVCSILRFHRLKNIIRNWTGSLLIFPS